MRTEHGYNDTEKHVKSSEKLIIENERLRFELRRVARKCLMALGSIKASTQTGAEARARFVKIGKRAHKYSIAR